MTISKYLFAQFYDVLNYCVEHKVKPYRLETAGRCTGATLEIGAGTGANIPYFKNVSSLSMVEPDKHMRVKLKNKYKSDLKSITLINSAGENLNLEDNYFDCVCTTLTLCMVENPEKVISEVYRVLKPGGSFYFYEHVQSKKNFGKSFQDKLNPFWKYFTTGCNLNRDIGSLFNMQTFRKLSINQFDLEFPLGISIPNIVGKATK